jgi:hypothetical protein
MAYVILRMSGKQQACSLSEDCVTALALRSPAHVNKNIQTVVACQFFGKTKLRMNETRPLHDYQVEKRRLLQCMFHSPALMRHQVTSIAFVSSFLSVMLPTDARALLNRETTPLPCSSYRLFMSSPNNR